MSDNELKKGDVCIYHYAKGNGSLNLVKITEIYTKDRCKIKCLQVLIDNSGNGWFDYLLRTGNEMIASNEYLHKIDTFSRQQAEYDRMKEENDKLNSDIQILVENSSKRTEVYQYIKTTTIKEIVDILKGIIENELCLTENETDYLCMRIDDEMKKVIGEEK
jgi:hypothetical protein